MDNLIETLRSILGQANFYVDGTLQLDLLFEYFVSASLLVLVVLQIFKIIRTLFER